MNRCSGAGLARDQQLAVHRGDAVRQTPQSRTVSGIGAKNGAAYRLRKTSRLINKGMPPPVIASDVPAAEFDFFGEPARSGKKTDIGVDEVNL